MHSEQDVKVGLDTDNLNKCFYKERATNEQESSVLFFFFPPHLSTAAAAGPSVQLVYPHSSSVLIVPGGVAC